MAEQKLCPTCHSKIAPSPLEVRIQGDVEPGIPKWSDDPGFNKRGTNGNEYKGDMFCRGLHLREIQDARKASEIEAGLVGDQLTEFSPINEGDDYILVRHLVELRESTEKILDASGGNLRDYFNRDADGNEVEPGPEVEPDKEEWFFVERGRAYVAADGSVKSSFDLPSGETRECPTPPRGHACDLMDLEELRHPLVIGWREFWSVSPVGKIAELPEDHAGHVAFDGTDSTGYTAEAPTSDTGKVEYELSVDTTNPNTMTPRNETRVFTQEEIDIFPVFPTEFEIHPTDGGNKYEGVHLDDSDPPVPEKLWVVQARTESAAKSIENFEYRGIIDNEGNQDVIFTESGETVKGSSLAKISVEALHDFTGKVNLLNELANTVKLVSESEAEISNGFIFGDAVIQVRSTISIRHQWNPDPVGGHVSKGSKKIYITKDTNFKFTVEVDGHDTTAYQPFVILGDPELGETPPGDTFNQEDGTFQPLLSTLVVYNENTAKEFVIVFRFGEDTREKVPADVITTAPSPFSGQIFKFVNVIPASFSNSGSVIVQLDGTKEFDVAINIDDLLSAFKLINSNLDYVGHKVAVDDAIVENPSAHKVLFKQSFFSLTTFGSTQNFSSFERAPGLTPHEEDTGFDLVPGAIGKIMKTRNSDAVAYINALRIESNPKKVQDTPS